MKNNMIYVFIFLCTVFFTGQAVAPWTWCYKKKFTTCSVQDAARAFVKEDIEPFTQLIFSHNTLMPQHGKYIFSVRIRYADTKTWSGWQQMIEWSQAGSKTFYGKHNDGLEYCYVRLELPQQKSADGFQIKIDTYDGVSLDEVKMLAVSVANNNNFEQEKYEAYSKEESIVIPSVPAWSQFSLQHPGSADACSPTALCGLTSFLHGKMYDPVSFIRGVFDPSLNIYGSWACNVAYAFNSTDGAVFFHVQRLHDFSVLLRSLYKNIPVIVSVRGALTGAPKTYPGGHLLVVVGFDANKQVVICNDSAVRSENVLKEYPLKEFLVAWENSKRLAYVGELNGV